VFVEWLMGLPRGHVTETGLPRSAQLRILGDGVVPQQAAYALRILLDSLDRSRPPVDSPRRHQDPGVTVNVDRDARNGGRR
jgi:hypothetical protein